MQAGHERQVLQTRDVVANSGDPWRRSGRFQKLNV